MSHFAILVIGDNVKEQLAPYQENNMCDCPKEYLKFFDKSEELEKDYENNTTSCFISPEGIKKSKYDKEFTVSDKKFPYNSEQVLPDGWVEEDVPVKEIYTFKEYAEDYCGYEYDDDQGAYGYWENPNAKWDWYVVGGRWSGFFKLKEGGIGELGNKGILTSEPEKGTADILKKGDIDLEAMRKEASDKASKIWDDAYKACNGQTWHSWEYVRDEIFKDNIDMARVYYHDQKALVAVKEYLDDPFYECDYLLLSREDFIKRAELRSTSLFGFLIDGKWVERGNMGWFGIATDEEDEHDWYDKFNKMLDNLPDDTTVTVVDCHI